MPKSLKVSLFALLLVGCDSPVDNDRHGLAQRQAAWLRLDLNDYSFVLEYACSDCTPDPYRIAVSADEVVSVVRIRDGATLPNAAGKTIDDVFDVVIERVEQARNDKNAVLTVEYSRQYHFPATVFWDYRGHVDAAGGMDVREFQPSSN
jgi:uncharacterized protein DUF6174